MVRRVMSTLAVLALWTAGARAQEPRLPNEAEVKALQAKYQAERSHILKNGIEKHFVPDLFRKAELLAQQAEKALSDGRLFQASESYRQARWLLPYQSKRVPAQHVSMILGSMRLRHEGGITAVAFSRDGKLLASAGKDSVVRVWDLENGHEITTYTGHANYVSAVVFSPDGKTVTSAAAEKDIRVWDPFTGKDVRKFASGEFVYSLAYTPDGKYLVSGQLVTEPKKENVLCIYEVESGKPHRTMNDFRNHQPQSIGFSGDGDLMAIGTSQGDVRLYDLPRTLKEQAPFPFWSQQPEAAEPCHVAVSADGQTLVHQNRSGVRVFKLNQAKGKNVPYEVVYRGAIGMSLNCASVIFTRDSKTLVVGCNDGLVRMYDAVSLVMTGTQKGHTGPVHALAYDRTGTILATGSNDHTVRITQSEVVIQSRDFVGHEGPVWKSSFSSDGRRLVSASADRTVRIWDVADGKVLHTLTGHTMPVTAALFSPDGNFVASAGGDRTIRIWNAQTGKLVRELPGHTHTVTCLDFSADGKKLISGSVDRTIKVWDWQAGAQMLTLNGSKSIIAAVAFRPDGKQIAAGSVDGTIWLYDADTGKLESSWSASGSAITGLAYSPDGKQLASSGADFNARIWNLTRPGTAILLSGHTGPVSAIAFRKDGRHVATCGSDLLVKLWRLEGDSGKEVQTFRGHKDWVTSVNFSKDGFYIVSSGVDRIIKINEITTRESPLGTEPAGNLVALAVSPDNKYLAAGSTDRIIRVFDRASGSEVVMLVGHTNEISALTFALDSSLLVSGSVDRTIRLWDVAAGKEAFKREGQTQNWTGHPYAPMLLQVAAAADGARLLCLQPQKKQKDDDKINRTKIIAYELATGKYLFDVLDERDIKLGSFSTDGKTAALASRDGIVRLYDLDKKGQMFPGGDWFFFEKESITDMALSADGALLAAGSDTGELRICKVAGKEVLHKIAAHARRIDICLISPDGKRVATVGGEDNLIKLWDLASGKELRRWSLGGPGRPLVSNLAFSADSKQLITSNANATLFVLELP